MVVDLKGNELNQLRVAFFSIIRKGVYLIGLEAPVRVILDLKASICS